MLQPSFVEIGPRVPGKKILKSVFTIYGHGNHVTSKHHVNEFSFHCTFNLKYKIWLKMARWFLREVNVTSNMSIYFHCIVP